MADCGHALCLPFDSCRFVVRTQDERDAGGQAWRTTAAGRPGYATWPQTAPGNPSWWQRDVPVSREVAYAEIDARVAPQHADFVKGVYDRLHGEPAPVDGETCTKWCGFCHLGTGVPAPTPAPPPFPGEPERTEPADDHTWRRIAPECSTSHPQLHADCDGCTCPCHRPAGHDGWHEDTTATRWTPVEPEPLPEPVPPLPPISFADQLIARHGEPMRAALDRARVRYEADKERARNPRRRWWHRYTRRLTRRNP